MALTTSKKQKILGIAVIAAVVAVTVALCVYAGIPMVRLASDPAQFRAWVDAHGIWGRMAFVGMVVLQVVVAVIPGEPFELAAGYAFGAWEGTALCILAGGIGGMLVFFLVRRFGMRLVSLFFPEEKLRSVSFLKTSPIRVYLYMVVFAIPGTPKDLLCYAAGLTDINPWVWLAICTVGRIPSVITSTLSGSAVGEQRYVTAIVVLVITLALSGAGLLAYRAIVRRHQEKTDKGPTE